MDYFKKAGSISYDTVARTKKSLVFVQISRCTEKDIKHDYNTSLSPISGHFEAKNKLRKEVTNG